MENALRAYLNNTGGISILTRQITLNHPTSLNPINKLRKYILINVHNSANNNDVNYVLVFILTLTAFLILYTPLLPICRLRYKYEQKLSKYNNENDRHISSYIIKKIQSNFFRKSFNETLIITLTIGAEFYNMLLTNYYVFIHLLYSPAE